MATQSSSIDIRLIPQNQYVTPTTGSTVTVNSNGYVRLLIDPAGSLLALTVALPSSPTDGDKVEICSTQAITTLTISGGTVIGTLTTMAIGTFAHYIFNGTAAKWFRIG